MNFRAGAITIVAASGLFVLVAPALAGSDPEPQATESVNKAPRTGRVLRRQLDGDAPREKIVNKRRRCSEPYRCSQLVLRDGRRRRELTGISQRPRYPYHWYVSGLQFSDLTGDGHPEIVWDLDTVGGTGSSPRLRGAHTWTGRRAVRIFRLRNAR